MESYTIDKYFSGTDRMIGGLYPNVDAVESFYDRLLDLQDDEELRWMELHGFTGRDDQFSPFSFDVHKVLEIAETIVNYFVATGSISKAGRYEDVHSLLETLLSAPESPSLRLHQKGRTGNGYLKRPSGACREPKE